MEINIGQKFVRLTIMSVAYKNKYGGWMYFVSCECNPDKILEKPIRDRDFFRKNIQEFPVVALEEKKLSQEINLWLLLLV